MKKGGESGIITEIHVRVDVLLAWRNKAGIIERGLSLEKQIWPGQNLMTVFIGGINKREKSV